MAPLQKAVAEMTAQKAGAAGDDHPHHCSPLFSSDAVIGESHLSQMFRVVDVAAVEDHGLPHHGFDALEIGIPECLPFRDKQQSIGAFQTCIVAGAELHARSVA